MICYYFRKDSITHNNNEIYPVEYKKGCDWANWSVAASYTIPSNFPSGFYYAKLYLPGQENNPDQVGYIPFVVRPSDPGSNRKYYVLLLGTHIKHITIGEEEVFTGGQVNLMLLLKVAQ